MVLMTISVKNTVFWDVTSCSLLYPRMLCDPFPSPLLLYNQSVELLVWKQFIRLKSWYLHIRLHSIMSQKTIILNLHAVTCDCIMNGSFAQEALLWRCVVISETSIIT
jgi:hypothetical protein